MAERRTKSELTSLRQAIAGLDEKQAKLEGRGLPKTVAALVHWRQTFGAKLKSVASNTKRRLKG